MPERLRARLAALGPPLLVAAVFLAVRYRLALTPELAQTYYDEALTGLMSLAILRGVSQVFYWGQPYLGAVDAYLAAAAFQLAGPSALALRMSAVVAALGWAWAVWSLARRTAGSLFGLLAGLAVAVPPVFLAYAQLSATGQSVAVSLGALSLAAGACLVDARSAPRRRTAAWLLLGAAGGLGWWASQIMAVFLLAAAACVVAVRPRVVRDPGAYAAAGLFLLGGAPFWLWNARREWVTFVHLATWGGDPSGTLASHLRIVADTLLLTWRGFFWDGRAVALTPGLEWASVACLGAFYLPGIALAAARGATWLGRLARREHPWREPLDLVVLAFWLTVGAHLFTWFGASGIIRYSMTFYATLPVLAAAALERLARRGPAWRGTAIALPLLALGANLAVHAGFVRQAAALPWRPVDAALARLDALGIRGCYADSRVAQVLAFESGGRLACADYHGYRDFATLRVVDGIEDPTRVAIVTHRLLQNPHPEEMAAGLRLLGATARRDEVGEYVIFHHVAPPGGHLRPIPREGWIVRATVSPETAARAVDRRAWTWWHSGREPGHVLELDLGRAWRLARLTFEGPPGTVRTPVFRVDTSPDGRVWDQAAAVANVLTGLHWWKGHPRLDETGRLVVHFPPRPARYVRVAATGPHGLAIAEVFAYEIADAPWEPPAESREALATAAAWLARWMDDPTGPHPRRAPETEPHRQRQVPWAAVFAASERAITAAPDWEEPHHQYGQALAWWGWSSEDPDANVEQARHDGAWGQVLGWARAADERNPDLWRSGRADAREEALRRLGRWAEANGARAAAREAEARSRPARAVRARFGHALELAGLDLPATARPGDPITLRFAWRLAGEAARNYAVRIRLVGSRRGGELAWEHEIGASHGTTRWAPGERVHEAVTFAVPSDVPAGTYAVRVGVRERPEGPTLRVGGTDLPAGRRSVVAGALTIEPALTAAPAPPVPPPHP